MIFEHPAAPQKRRGIWFNNLQASLNALESAGDFAFQSITDIQISDSVIKISHGAFEDLPGLKNIRIPNSVEEIETCAFCATGLTGLIIPESVKSISDHAFGGHNSSWKNSSIPQIIYCSESIINQCSEAVKWKKDLGESVEVISYQKTTDGKVFYNNHWYNSANDILFGHYIPKRIYTIDEANRVAGSVNRVSITYR